MDFIAGQTSVWQSLAQTQKPIAVYGMGDGAEKILRVCDEKGIRVDSIFASDEYVRGHSFMGYRVKRLDEVTAEYGDIVIVVAFAVHDEGMLSRLNELDSRYELYAPDVPVAGGGLFDEEYVRNNALDLETAYHLWEDDLSRQVFLDLVRFKVSGRLQYLRSTQSPKEDALLQIIRPHARERYVDLGAYDGDTIRELLRYTGGAFEQITAFEPDAKNLKKLRDKLSASLQPHMLPRVQAHNLLAHSAKATLTFAARAGRNSALAKKGEAKTKELAADSVDNMLAGCPATLIKLDVEGAEHNALLGCAKTIRQFAPRLIVSAYHRNEDLFDLPLLVKRLNPAYKLYLRRHPYVPAWDINLYAVTG